MVADIFPGSNGSNPADLMVVGDKLFFSAVDPQAGRELWMAFDADTDRDGVPNETDQCPAPDLDPTIVVDGVDSGVLNRIFTNGCSLADLIASLINDSVNEVSNYGQFVKGVAHGLNMLKQSGLITGQEKGAILRLMTR